MSAPCQNRIGSSNSRPWYQLPAPQASVNINTITTAAATESRGSMPATVRPSSSLAPEELRVERPRIHRLVQDGRRLDRAACRLGSFAKTLAGEPHDLPVTPDLNRRPSVGRESAAIHLGGLRFRFGTSHGTKVSEDASRLRYIRGPEGIIAELAEEIG